VRWLFPAIVRSGLGLAGLLLAACGGRDTGGDWTMRVDTVRAGAEPGTRVAASLRSNGKEGPEGAAPTHDVVLSFDCFGENATVTIMTDQALRQGSTEVRLRVDSAPARTIKGFAGTTSTGGKVLLTIAQDSLLAWLNGHRRAIVNYADGAGSYKTTAEFPIGGLERHRASFLLACGTRTRNSGDVVPDSTDAYIPANSPTRSAHATVLTRPHSRPHARGAPGSASARPG
jgi:hypothetical protein